MVHGCRRTLTHPSLKAKAEKDKLCSSGLYSAYQMTCSGLGKFAPEFLLNESSKSFGESKSRKYLSFFVHNMIYCGQLKRLSNNLFRRYEVG
jgi:hypothetical protein